MWDHIIKYIPYPSKQLYKVIHNTTAYKRLCAKSIISIQRFYRRHRAPRSTYYNMDIKKISKKMLIRIYMTQYPINKIDNLVYMFNRKIRAFHPYELKKFKNVSPLRRLYICLDMHTIEEINYVNTILYLYQK
jgi:hypothetical protein